MDSKNICTIYIFTFLLLLLLFVSQSHSQLVHANERATSCNSLAPLASTRYFSSEAARLRAYFKIKGRGTADTRLESCHMQHDIMIVIVRRSRSLSLSPTLCLSINSTRATGCPIGCTFRAVLISRQQLNIYIEIVSVSLFFCALKSLSRISVINS